MTFDAFYATDDETDAGHRVLDAPGLQEVKAVLRAQLEAEGTHGHCRLLELWETDASFAARMAHKGGK